MRALTVALVVLGHLGAQQQEEPSLKAHLLERISHFITWPQPLGAQETQQPFVVLILGESPVFAKNPVGAAFEQVFAERKIKGRPVKVTYAMKLTIPPTCELLYLANRRKADLPPLLALLKSSPILIASDSPGFAEAGVHINFIREGRSLRFEMNPFAIKESGLMVDALLASSAVLVKGEVRK